MSEYSISCLFVYNNPLPGLWVYFRSKAILAIQTVKPIFSIFSVLSVNSIIPISTVFAVNSILAIGSGVTLITLGSSLAGQILEKLLNGKV